jgi:hypothetical protein
MDYSRIARLFPLDKDSRFQFNIGLLQKAS